MCGGSRCSQVKDHEAIHQAASVYIPVTLRMLGKSLTAHNAFSLGVHWPLVTEVEVEGTRGVMSAGGREYGPPDILVCAQCTGPEEGVCSRANGQIHTTKCDKPRRKQ